MGNCTSRTKKKRKDESAPDDKPVEDVTYASIDHSTAKGPRTSRAVSDNDCDYATVQVPAALQPQPECGSSSKDECADDYVLMG
ncbi:uncharacterized protein si:ch211-214p13.7 [Hippoglossus hippoglossus]|uniref:uncharacterized protein si:ch211-214p13.7 n=1 Tax=Hippoglossus hippoglossus TaxID=8267 RepID=UPI00148C020C|nr:uncharacterized protein si:ch211-214p13.7 [Hippoglossus hippoglossus]